jgi:hypothetical protein
VKIEIEFEGTERNRQFAERFLKHLRERGALPITRSLTDGYEMGKVDFEIEYTRAELVDIPESTQHTPSTSA